jgi:hypothetical protein
MNRQKIIQALSCLGKFMSQFQFPDSPRDNTDLNDLFYDEFQTTITSAKIYNGWFEERSVRRSIFALSKWLKEDTLSTWSFEYKWNPVPKKIAIIMAGNIPLVGFHDYVCGLISGNHMLIKLSKEDKLFLPLMTKVLIHLDSSFEERIEFTEGVLKDFDAVIATGSDNSARYFDHYFSSYHHLIRKNRNSVAVLTGDESKEDLAALGDDIFAYFGLGCRNVSKVYVPDGYRFELFFEALFDYKYVVDNKKYANNFDYHRALYLMGGHDMLENGFLLLKEDAAVSSPISMLHYETYKNLEVLKKDLISKSESIQCIVSSIDFPNSFNLGQAQCPGVNDYADGVDTLAFLSDL